MRFSGVRILACLFLGTACVTVMDRENKSPVLTGSMIELVESIPKETNLDQPDIRNTYEVWLEMIRGAQTALDFEQFYIVSRSGEPMDTVLDAIREAAARGVKVRFIVDARFYRTYPQWPDSLAKSPNITVRIIDFNKMTGGVQHAKFFIADQREIFVGSQNFDWRALTHIHETGLRVRHPEAAAFFQQIFDLDWAMAETNETHHLDSLLKPYSVPLPLTFKDPQWGEVWLTPTASPLGWLSDTNVWDERQLLRLIEQARHELRLQFMLYGTIDRKGKAYRTLDDAIRNAAARGVKVRILVSDWILGRAAENDLRELVRIPNIEIKISSIPEWSRGYISFARVEHCKFIVADSSVFWLGTSNAEKSYFYTSRNVGLIIQNPSLTAQLIRKFDWGWNGLYTARYDPQKKYSPRKRDGE